MDDSLALTPPEPLAPLATDTVGQRVKLSDEELTKLNTQVAELVETFLNNDVESETFRQNVQAVSQLGAAEIAASASVSNRMLERPEVAKTALEKKSGVSKSLADLRNVIENLDPSTQGHMFAPRRLLGLIPFGSQVRTYFDRYKSAQSQLDAIMQMLYKGKDELLRDNAAIENEKTAMWGAMQKMRAAVYLCENIDSALEARTTALATTDADRAKTLREDVLLSARQRRVDLLTQLAVNIQSYQVLDILKKNNIELMKGVDRATTTTVSALRTAVTASQALAGQRLVLNQISALNQTTGAMIESTSQLLGTQGVAIHEQASNATIDIDRLKAAFTNIYAALDAVDVYKAKALTNLSQSANMLGDEIAKAETRLKK
jgi:uncharacterized protein YaaN involved in tellurite resistance